MSCQSEKFELYFLRNPSLPANIIPFQAGNLGQENFGNFPIQDQTRFGGQENLGSSNFGRQENFGSRFERREDFGQFGQNENFGQERNERFSNFDDFGRERSDFSNLGPRNQTFPNFDRETSNFGHNFDRGNNDFSSGRRVVILEKSDFGRDNFGQREIDDSSFRQDQGFGQGDFGRDPFSSRNAPEMETNRYPFTSRSASEIETNRDPFSSRNNFDLGGMSEPVRVVDRLGPDFRNSDLRNSSSNLSQNFDRESNYAPRVERESNFASAVQTELQNFGRNIERDTNLGKRIEQQTKFAPDSRELLSDFGRQQMERELSMSAIERASNLSQRNEQPQAQQRDFGQGIERGSTSFEREVVSKRQGIYEPIVAAGNVSGDALRRNESSTNNFRIQDNAGFGRGGERPPNFSGNQSYVAGQRVENVEMDRTRFGQVRTSDAPAEFGGQMQTSSIEKNPDFLTPQMVPKPNPLNFVSSNIGQGPSGVSRAASSGPFKVGASNIGSEMVRDSNFGSEMARDSNFGPGPTRASNSAPSDKIASQNAAPPASPKHLVDRSRGLAGVPVNVWSSGSRITDGKDPGPGMPRSEAAIVPALQVKGLPPPARSALRHEQPKRPTDQASGGDKGNLKILEIMKKTKKSKAGRVRSVL